MIAAHGIERVTAAQTSDDIDVTVAIVVKQVDITQGGDKIEFGRIARITDVTIGIIISQIQLPVIEVVFVVFFAIVV